MNSRFTWRLLLTVGIAFLGGMAGALIGQTLFATHADDRGDLHHFVHASLDLDSSQRSRIEILERHFTTRKHALELDLRSDNARLAEAIETEHDNGPAVAAAVDRSHLAMGNLQKLTIAHIFEMRQVLRPAQAAKFDAAVVGALTEESR